MNVRIASKNVVGVVGVTVATCVPFPKVAASKNSALCLLNSPITAPSQKHAAASISDTTKQQAGNAEGFGRSDPCMCMPSHAAVAVGTWRKHSWRRYSGSEVATSATTRMNRAAVISHPAASVTVYVTRYTPGTFVFSSEVSRSLLSVKSPSSGSNETTPGSTQTVPTPTSLRSGPAPTPLSVSDGHALTGGAAGTGGDPGASGGEGEGGRGEGAFGGGGEGASGDGSSGEGASGDGGGGEGASGDGSEGASGTEVSPTGASGGGGKGASGKGGSLTGASGGGGEGSSGARGSGVGSGTTGLHASPSKISISGPHMNGASSRNGRIWSPMTSRTSRRQKQRRSGAFISSSVAQQLCIIVDVSSSPRSGPHSPLSLSRRDKHASICCSTTTG